MICIHPAHFTASIDQFDLVINTKHAPFNVCQRFSASCVKFCQSIKPAWRTLSWWPSCSRRWCRPLSLGHHFQPWPRNWSHPCCPGSLNHWNVRNKKCYFRTWTSRTPTVKRNVESVSRNNKERNPISRRKIYLINQNYKLFSFVLCLNNLPEWQSEGE